MRLLILPTKGSTSVVFNLDNLVCIGEVAAGQEAIIVTTAGTYYPDSTLDEVMALINATKEK
jgi:hypothetical protein